MKSTFDRSRSLEQLEGRRWPDPPQDSTSLVKVVHALRRRPVEQLTVEELARLIGQEVGLRWLMPVALEILRETAPGQAAGGFYDDDLLTAVLTVNPDFWRAEPGPAAELREILGILVDLGPYIEPDAERFLKAFPGVDS
ncbi:contact-dependent growth inhibition system immunity protein [Streptomyces sp. NPDC051211]|uniref:contact-dependent growth inhibition system immunity protein n=1 Tax=Streptomyces sp. NPDC051211 TaxID=3154643 RepID=UPI00344C1775